VGFVSPPVRKLANVIYFKCGLQHHAATRARPLLPRCNLQALLGVQAATVRH